MNKKNSIILTLISFATLLIAIIGATFAYFTAQADVRSEQSVQVQTVTMPGLIYDAGENDAVLALDKAIPGDHGESTFTVTNPRYIDIDETIENTTTMEYSMAFVVDTNEFSISEEEHGEEQLFLEVEFPNSSAGAGFKVNLTNGEETEGTTIRDDLLKMTIAPGVTQTWTVKMNFVETNEIQNENMNKSFAGHFIIENIQIAQ